MEPLFVDRERALLGSPPTSSPPKRPTNRRKTLAGMTIARTYLRRSTATTRTSARRKAAPVAKKAEALVCQSLGIISNGQVVTDQALAEFARRFEGQISQEVITGFRLLFKLDDPRAVAIDEALIEHGGAAALDAVDEEDALSNV